MSKVNSPRARESAPPANSADCVQPPDLQHPPSPTAHDQCLQVLNSPLRRCLSYNTISIVMAKPTSDSNTASATAPVKYNVGWRRVVRNFSPSYDRLPQAAIPPSPLN
jgi:hypothetical protein